MKSKGAFIVNLIFWLLIVALISVGILNSTKPVNWFELLVEFGFYGLINFSLFYINYLILIPNLIKIRQNSWLYFFLILALIALSVVIKLGIAVLFPEIILEYGPATKRVNTSYNVYMLQALFISGFFTVISTLLKFSADWFANERIQRNLETQKKDMELQFLKSQLNPHFLFNSLNNIYSLAYQKSEKTPDAILKLSEIMRYMIYESNDSWVDLDKEIDYVKSFVELQKLRFKDGATVKITVEGEIDGQQIVPLLLISFVENAFKHGVANDPKDPIKINVVVDQKTLRFSVSNKKNTANKDSMGGVGLNNVERRLQLLYPDQYQLTIENSATHYTTHLILNL